MLMPLRCFSLAARAAGLVILSVAACAPPGSAPESSLGTGALVSHAIRPIDRPVSFEADVKPVLENRCVVCHACYDGPCQLLFSSPDGIARGASKENVYDTSRLTAAAPT